MASTALQTLGVTPASLGERYQAASTAYEGATKKVSDSLEQKNAALAPLEQQMKDTRAAAPAAPKLDNVNQQFQYVGMDKAEMNDMLSTMFAFAAIGGAMTRTPMTAALGAFAKGVEGFAKGDMVNYKRQRDVFDRNFKSAIAKNQQAISEYKLAYDKNKGDLQNLMTDWRMIAAKHGDSVALAQFEAGNARGAMQHLESLVKMDEAGKRADQQFAASMARLDAMERQREADRISRETIARGRNEVKERAAALGGKPSPTERQHYMDSNALVKSVTRVRDMLADPAIRAKVDEARIGNFLSDAIESKTIQQFMVRPNLDPQVKQYLAEVANLRNQYYLDMSGKAVTGGEALRNYGAVMQPGDTAADVLNKMSIAETRATEKMRDLETYFPSLSVIRGGGAGATPPQAPSAAPQQATPPVNAKGWPLMTDAAGNKAYVGPNKEIEEVQ